VKGIEVNPYIMRKYMLNLNHKNLDVWKMSISFVAMIYELTGRFLKSEM